MSDYYDESSLCESSEQIINFIQFPYFISLVLKEVKLFIVHVFKIGMDNGFLTRASGSGTF
jgi:hypothetical protein